MGNENVERFLNGTVFYFKFIGFEFDAKRRWMQYQLVLGLLSMAFMIAGQGMFLICSDIEIQKKTSSLSYLNYFLVSIGKVIALIYNRKACFETMNEFRRLYPSVQLETAYNVQRYLKQFLLMENVLAGFYKSITFIYIISPLFISLIELVRDKIFSYRNPLMTMYPFEIPDTLPVYIIMYLIQTQCCYESATIILASDLFLFSALFQLCMHFEIIAKHILQIEPDQSDEAEKRLKEQIAYHQRVLRLADKVNDIFTPSVLFSLLSSSLILCFTGYQLLGDINIMTFAKAIALLCYELKQVVITCFLGERLMATSYGVSNAIYEHKWYNGKLRYKRLALMVLMRSQQSSALSLAGITEISLQTLRAVMSNSYQIFTVLKTK